MSFDIPNALAVHQITFGYTPATPVVRNVSLDILRGEFLTLAGPNGSGKTTLLRLLNRILLPNSGTITLSGQALATLARSAIARRMAFVPQDSGPQFPFTALETVLMGRAPHLHGVAFENARDRSVAAAMMEMTDTEALAHAPITELSGGERQRVYIARALAQEPEILLLDEPNAHLDIAHQVEMFRLLKKLKTESGITIVSVSHDLNLASAYSDRIALLVQGTLAAIGTPAEVLTEDRIKSVFHTAVSVDRHPAHGVPRVTLLG